MSTVQEKKGTTGATVQMGEPEVGKADLKIESKHEAIAEMAQTRTQEFMRQDMKRKTPGIPTIGLEDGEAPIERDKLSEHLRHKLRKHFLPTTNPTNYLKQKAALHAKGVAKEKPLPAQLKAKALEHISLLAPGVFTGPDIEGAVDVDGVMPPDTHGAIGPTEFVETTNMHIDIFQRADPTQRTSISLAAFFGYFTQALFDARVIYDNEWGRWIITADAFPESPDLQYHFIAVSTTSSANGSFFIYAVNVTFASGDFWDYPQLGMDQDSIIITANIFDSSGNFKGADMFAVAKARLYNGWGFWVPVFTGLEATLAPPIVSDQNANAFLVAAPGGSSLKLYKLTNSSRPNGISLTGPVDVPVDAYQAPAPAPQPGTSALLDTLDGRFVNASTQVGDSLWQVHSVDFAGFATPKFYQINTATNSIMQSDFFYASGTSFDFNASIAANSDGDVFLTWTSTDASAGINPQVRFAGCDHNDGPTVPGSGIAIFTSPTSFGGGRWGDYSAVTIDPTNPRQAWLVNEDVAPNGDWGTRIDGIGF
jgi:hypothetical protein